MLNRDGLQYCPKIKFKHFRSPGVNHYLDVVYQIYGQMEAVWLIKSSWPMIRLNAICSLMINIK